MMVHCKRARPCKVLLSRLHFGKLSLFLCACVCVYWGIDKIIFNWCLSSWNAIINSIVSKRPPGRLSPLCCPKSDREREGDTKREWERSRAFGPILGRPNKSLLLLLLSFALQLCHNIVLASSVLCHFGLFFAARLARNSLFNLPINWINRLHILSPCPLGSGPFQSWYPPATFFCLLMSLIYVVNCFRF